MFDPRSATVRPEISRELSPPWWQPDQGKSREIAAQIFASRALAFIYFAFIIEALR
jgi:hypothetical protein